LSEDKVVRLTCLDLFHPECIDVHASSLPPHTAKAGYLCPICSKPIFPPELENNPLVKQLTNYLSHAPWAKNLIIHPETIVQLKVENTTSSNTSPSTLEGGLSSPIAKRTNDPSQDSTIGISSRKPPRDHTPTTRNEEEEEDKYQKRSLTQLLVALGIMSNTSKNKSRTRIRFDTRKILLLFAVITCLVTVVVLGMSLTSEINTITSG